MASYYDTEVEEQKRSGKVTNVALPILAALEAIGTSIATKGRNPSAHTLGIYKDVQGGREAALERALGRDKSAADSARDAKLLGFQEAAAKRDADKFEAEDHERQTRANRRLASIDRMLGTLNTTDDATNTVTMGMRGLPDLTPLDREKIRIDPEKFAFEKAARDPLQDFIAKWDHQVSNPKPVATTTKTTEQIEAEAAAKARGAASVVKPMSPEQAQTVRTKLASLGTARRQIQDVKNALEAKKKSMLSGKGRGWIPTKENAAFEKATAALKPTIQVMTRIPGVGAMSDFETRLAMAPYPEAGEYDDVNEQAIAGLESLINEIETGYKGMGVPAGEEKAPGAPAQVPEGTEKTNAQGVKMRMTGGKWRVAQ